MRRRTTGRKKKGTWGGARPGAGRKPKGEVALAPHRARPALASRTPVQVTLTADATLPSLRSEELRGEVVERLRRGKEREGFRIVHFSLEAHRLHLLVEAKDADALSGGIKGLCIRLARHVNRRLGRRGRLFVDRYLTRVLRTPREARDALVAVLLRGRLDAQRRGESLAPGEVDRCSSEPWFDGWVEGQPEPPGEDAPVAAPRTWLLAAGWRRHGLISRDAVPGELSPGG